MIALLIVNIYSKFIQITGHPSTTICEFARAGHGDLIAIGRRGHSRLNAMLLGGVSNYVVHHAPCSILLVPTPIVDQSTLVDEVESAISV